MKSPGLEDAIRKTGFVLEYNVTEQLKKFGWSVINNKYYVDDAVDIVREIDLVAYKCELADEVNVYTVLIVSCKKSESNTWAFLSKKFNPADPNINSTPLHAWSNNKVIEYWLQKADCGKSYHEGVSKMGADEVVKVPEVDVFAFQEIDSKKFTAQNDKAIFSSITSLMKAQSYEMAALPMRKKKASVYQFNLISIVEGEMSRLMFDGDKITAKSIESEQYLARYIVRKQDTFAKIRFIRSDKFDRFIPAYNKLHKANVKWVESRIIEFYKDIFDDGSRLGVFLGEFTRIVESRVGWSVKNKFNFKLDLGGMHFSKSDEGPLLKIGIFADEGVIEFMNSDERCKKSIADALKEMYRFQGEFEFIEWDLF